MNLRKWLIGGSVMLCMTLGTAVLADSWVSVVVNGTKLRGEMDDGSVMVKADGIAKAMGANVKWEPKNKKMIITSPPAQSSDSRQIELLQLALAAQTPAAAADSWAKGVKERNGALQYTMLSKSLKDSTRKTFENLNWTTGQSSPWMASYSVSGGKELGAGKWSYEVSAVYTDSTKASYPQRWELQVIKEGDSWKIGSITVLSGSMEDVPGEAKITHTSKTMGYSIELPATWQGKYKVRENASLSELQFVSRTDMKASIISFYTISSKKWKQDPHGQLRKLAEKNGKVYYCVLPLDNPFSGDEVEQYGRMVEEAKRAVQTFKLLK